MEDNQFLGIDYQQRRPIGEGKERFSAANRGKIGKLVKNVKAGSEFKAEQHPRANIKPTGKSKKTAQIETNKVEEMIEKAIKYRQRYNQLNSQPLQRNIQLPLHSIPEVSKESMKTEAKIQDEAVIDTKMLEIPSLPVVLQKKRSLKSAEKGSQGKIVRNILNHNLLKTTNKDKDKEPRLIRSNTQSNQLKMQLSPIKDRRYVRKIFADAVEEAKYKQGLKAAQQRSKERKQKQLKELQQKEEYLGSVVYNRTGKHLRAFRKRTGSYLQQIKGEEKVDESIIRFLRFKVQRANTMMS